MYRKKETSFIKMSRIIGTPVSFFFLHRQLTIEQLEIILSSMERIHNTSSKIGERCIGNIYANYSEKLRYLDVFIFLCFFLKKNIKI